MPNAVRLARTSDADAIARVQVRSWDARDPLAAAAALEAGLDAAAIADAWGASLLAARHPYERLLVATDADDRVVGFAATVAADDADAVAGMAELVALEVDPEHGAQGHGSRLLAAAADTLREAGAQSCVAWVPVRAIAFLAEAGFAEDGAERTLAGPGGAPLLRRRMATALG